MRTSYLRKLRSILEEMAEIPTTADPRVDVAKGVMAKLELSFRDVRLELFRLESEKLSEEQIKSVKRLGERLEMVAKGNAEPFSIATEAKRTLVAFGWN